MIIPCGHTMCVNCVIQIIKVSEEDYESYSNSSVENDYEDFFNSDENSVSSESSSENSQVNSANEEIEESQESQESEEEEDEETDPIEIKFEIDNNISDFNFDCFGENEENQKSKFFMGDEKKDNEEDGKLIKFKCSLCRKKMKINSKQIIKNIQLSELIKSLDRLNGTTQYLGTENDKSKNKQTLENNNYEDNIDVNCAVNDKNKQTKYNKFQGKIFCNLCKNIFEYSEHIILSNITDFHKKNFLFIDEEFLYNLSSLFDTANEYNINSNTDIRKFNTENHLNNNHIDNQETNENHINLNHNENLSDINQEIDLYKDKLNKRFEKIIEEKLEGKEINDFSHRLQKFLKIFLNLSLNYGLSKNKENPSEVNFDFLNEENQKFKFDRLSDRNPINNELGKDEYCDFLIKILTEENKDNNDVKDTIFFNNMTSYVEAFSNFKKCRHKSFMELSSIYLSFESLIEDKNFCNAEKKLFKADKLLEKFFGIFDKLKINFALFLKGKVVLNREKIQFTSNLNKKDSYNYKTDDDFNSNNNYKNENLIKSKNFPVLNNKYYSNDDFKIRINNLVMRKGKEVSLKYFKSGFFDTVIKNTILSEKRYSVWLENDDFKKKAKLYLFDNLFNENIFYLNYNKLILTTLDNIKSGDNPTQYAERSEVYTPNIISDETGLNIFFIGSDDNSNKFRVYSLSKKMLIELPKIPEEYYTVDTLFHDNKLFILGGNNSSDIAILNCYFYDVFKRKWFKLPKLNISRFEKCSFIKNGYIYVYGGHPGSQSVHNDSWSSDNNTNNNINNSLYSTQLWKFETLDLKSIQDYENNLEKLDEKWKWEVIEIQGFNHKLMEFGYSLIDESKLIILGGIQDESSYYSHKGFIIDLDQRKIVEYLKIDFDIDNHMLSSNYYRGSLQVFLGSDEDRTIKYNRNFDNLNIYI